MQITYFGVLCVLSRSLVHTIDYIDQSYSKMLMAITLFIVQSKVRIVVDSVFVFGFLVVVVFNLPEKRIERNKK